MSSSCATSRARPRIEDDKADILAAVSYELRTPLVPIRGFLDTLTERGEKLDADERQHAYEVMLRETRRLERLAKQLRKASSLEEAVLQVVPERLDWGQAVRDQVENIQREQPNREFPVTIADDLPPVMADDHLAAQVLANLLSNAVRVLARQVTGGSDRGVRAGARLHHDRRRGRRHRRRRPRPDLRSLHDSCRPGSDGQQGVGLGLYIVRRAVEAMGGMVWVDDAADRRLGVHVHPPGSTDPGEEVGRQDSVIVTLLMVTGGLGGPSSCGADARICLKDVESLRRSAELHIGTLRVEVLHVVVDTEEELRRGGRRLPMPAP